MNQTPPKLIYIVVSSLALLAFMGLGSLCLSMFYKNYVDPAVLTSIISMTSATVGALGGILSSPRSAVTQTTTSTDSDGTKTTTTQPVMLAPVATASPAGTAADPIKTEQVNTEANPAIVKEAGTDT